MKTERIRISDVELNTGQVPGLPSNPREWTREELNRLKKSIKETPELLEARGVIVYPHGEKFVVLGGNMRLAAARELKMEEVPCIVVPEDTPVEKLKEIVIKDNGSFGSWDFDALGNEWDDLPLTEWGLDVWNPEKEKDVKSATELLSGLEYEPMYYEPKEKPTLKLKDCVNLTKFNAKLKELDKLNLTDEQKEVLKLFAYRFIKIDFEAVANYYFFNASEDEKKAIERLRLVLVDDGSINGFVQDDLLKVLDLATEFAFEHSEENDE